MDAFEKWLRDNDGVEDGKWEYAEKAFRAGMLAAAALCEARFRWIKDEPDMSYEADGARMCINDILAEADK